MAEYGLLIDYNYCTGCQSCEVACQQEHTHPVGQTLYCLSGAGRVQRDGGVPTTTSSAKTVPVKVVAGCTLVGRLAARMTFIVFLLQ